MGNLPSHLPPAEAILGAHSDPSIPPRDGQCHLLKLPGEILNEIYEYVLTADNDFAYAGETSLENPWNSKLKDINMLKDVCRRLRYETSGLELKFNKNLRIVHSHLSSRPIVPRRKPVTDRDFVEASVDWKSFQTTFTADIDRTHYNHHATLESFSKTLSHLQFRYVTRVVVDGLGSYLSPYIDDTKHGVPLNMLEWRLLAKLLASHNTYPQRDHALVKFARTHPATQVLLRESLYYLPKMFPDGSTDYGDLLEDLCILLLHIQAALPIAGEDRHLNSPTRWERAVTDADMDWLRGRWNHMTRLPNLRYLPSVDQFEEASVTQALRDFSREKGCARNWSLSEVVERLAWLKALFATGV